MIKILISFGQIHIHEIGDTIFDKDSLAIITCKDVADGRRIAFDLFGDKFMTNYPIEKLNDEEFMSWYPRGGIEVDQC